MLARGLGFYRTVHGKRRSVVGVLAAALLGFAAAAPAANAASGTADSVSPTVVSEGPPSTTAVSCSPDGGLCAVVDSTGHVITDRGGVWSAPEATDSSVGFTSVSCPTSSFCVAVGGTRAVVYNGSTWSSSTVIDGYGYLESVSCASSTFCAAVDTWGDAVTYDGSAWTAPQQEGGTTPGGFTSVSCPTSTFCVADGERSAVYDGSTWSQGNGGGYPLSCATAGFCVAFAYNGSFDEHEPPPKLAMTTYDGTTWSTLQPIPVTGGVTSISCPTTSFCMVLGDSDAFIYDGANWDSGTTVDPQGVPFPVSCAGSVSCVASEPLVAVSCASRVSCVAIDADGYAFVFEAGTWSRGELIDGDGIPPVPPSGNLGWIGSKLSTGTIGSVSCATSRACVALDDSGHAFMYDGTHWGPAVRVDRSESGFASRPDVSCPAVTYCVSVSGPSTFTYNGKRWSASVNVDRNGVLRQVSCATKRFCVAIDSLGHTFTFDGRRWSNSASDLPHVGNHPLSLSCATSSFCVATVDNGVAFRYNGRRWSKPTRFDSASRAGSGSTSVSCPTAAFCMAVEGNADAFIYSGKRWTPTPHFPAADPNSVSCATTTSCVAVGIYGYAFTYDGERWNESTPLSTSVTPDSVSCPTTSFCAAAGEDSGTMFTDSAQPSTT